MKYKKYAALALAAALAGTTLAGCGTVEEPEPEVEEEIVAAVEEVEEPVEEEEAITVIGDWQNASESVMMTNQMGGTIVGLAIKEPEDAQYPENLMETDQWFMNGEQAMVYYEPPGGAAAAVSEAEATAEITGTITGEISSMSAETTVYGEETEEDAEVLTEAEAVANAWAEANAAALAASAGTAVTALDAEGLEGEAELLEETEVIGAEDELAETVAITEADLPEVDVNDLGYFLEVTMENNKVYEITCFPIDDMDEVTLCCDDDVAYLQYTSLSDGTVVNTKAVEIIIKNNKEAAEEVTAMIAALPAVSELNAEAVAEQAAKVRVSYNNLTPAQRAYVTNLVHLEELENSLKSILGEDALDALIDEKELEDTDVINAEIETVDTYDTWDTGGMAYRETYEDTEEWTGDFGGDDYDYGNVSTGTGGDQSVGDDQSVGYQGGGDTGGEDNGGEDTGGEDTGSVSTGGEDNGGEDTGSVSTGGEDNGGEGSGGEGSGGEDSGGEGMDE